MFVTSAWLCGVCHRISWVFMAVVTFQDLQGSVVDPGRVLQHQGRHPERDDGSAQVPGRGMHWNYTNLTWASHK